MTVTETPEREATGIGYWDIGWSADTALLCMKHGHLFGEESRSAGAPPLLELDDLLTEHEDLTAEILSFADDAIRANYRAWENTHQHTMVLAGEARDSIDQARQEAIAGRVMIEAIASLHMPPAVETVTSVEVLPALEPLPQLAAATVIDNGDDPEAGDPDDGNDDSGDDSGDEPEPDAA